MPNKKVRKGLELCATTGHCDNCPYDAKGDECILALCKDAYSYITELEKENVLLNMGAGDAG